jgi:hypothetical protein
MDLARMSLLDLEEADTVIAAILSDLDLCKAPKSEAERYEALYAAALEKVLVRRMGAVESLEFEGELREVLDKAEKILGPGLAKEMEPVTRRYLERAFRAGHAMRGLPGTVQTLFDKPRREAVDWLVEHDGFYLGKVFPEFVREPFRDAIAGGIQEGLGRKDIARRLKDIMAGSPDAPGKDSAYTRVASVGVNRANNWGGAFALEAAQVETYTWRTSADERVCPRCGLFDGKTFSTGGAMALVRKALASPPEAIEKIAPWPREDAETGEAYIETGGKREFLRGKDEAWLQEQGLCLAPLHAGCRCVILPEVG